MAGSEDATVRAWALDSGACLQIYEGHLSAIRSMHVLPYSEVREREGQGRLSDAASKSGKPWARQARGPRPGPAPPGGIICTAACDLRVWDIDSGDVIEVMARRRCDALALHGPLLLAAFQGAVRSFAQLPAAPPPCLTRPSPVLRPVVACKQEPAAKSSGARPRSQDTLAALLED